MHQQEIARSRAVLDDSSGAGLFLATFRDGRFVPRWSWIVPLMWLVQALLWATILMSVAPVQKVSP
jgi:hypothetical protein